MLDLATIEHSRRLRKRYLAWVHVLAAVACLMVVGQYRHIDTLDRRLAVQGDVLALLHAEQQLNAGFHAEIALLKRRIVRYKIIDYIRAVAPGRPARRIADAILKACDTHGVDPLLYVGLVKAESETRARGLSQIVKSTAKEIGLPWQKAYQIEPNVYFGALYLRRLLDATNQDSARALRRYNGNYDPDYPAKVLAVHAELAGH